MKYEIITAFLAGFLLGVNALRTRRITPLWLRKTVAIAVLVVAFQAATIRIMMFIFRALTERIMP